MIMGAIRTSSVYKMQEADRNILADRDHACPDEAFHMFHRHRLRILDALANKLMFYEALADTHEDDHFGTQTKPIGAHCEASEMLPRIPMTRTP